MGFFSNRRKRESAIPESADAQALGSFTSSERQPVIGQQVGESQFGETDSGEIPETVHGLAALTQLGPTIDMRGTDLGAEIREIMGQHGIEPGAGLAPDVDPNSLTGMQQQILQALARHGIDPNAAGSSIDFTPPDQRD